MTMARAHLVDVSVTRWYHCITRCVRRAFLLGEGPMNRKEWIESRLEELSGIFAVAVGGFSVLDNHLHVLVRLDPETAKSWSDEEVVRRWGRLFAPRDKSRRPLPVSNDWVQWRLKDARWVATARERLQSLSWFMKCLKEPLARLANRQDQTRGAFFEERFKSVAILDEESLWLCPIEDRRQIDSSREGMLEGMSLGSYLLLVDYTGRLFRDGKAAISAELSGIFERLGSTAESWWSRIDKLSKGQKCNCARIVCSLVISSKLQPSPNLLQAR